MALQRVDEKWLAELGELLSQSEGHLEVGKVIDALSIARRFHLAIAKRTGNALLLKLLEGISDRIQMVGLSLVDKLPARSIEVMRENREILESFRQRDAIALQGAVQKHISRSRDLIFKET